MAPRRGRRGRHLRRISDHLHFVGLTQSARHADRFESDFREHHGPKLCRFNIDKVPNVAWQQSYDWRRHFDRHCSYGRSSGRSEEHTSELQSRGHLVCRLLLEKKKKDEHETLAAKKKDKQQVTVKVDQEMGEIKD